MSWNQSQGKPVPPPRPSHLRGVLAGMLVVVSAVGAYFAFFTSPASSKAAAPKPKAAPITEAKPAVVAKPETNAETGARPKTNAVPAFVKRPGALQLPSGKVLTFPPPKEGKTRKVYASGHTYECDHLGNFVDITPRKFFHTAFEANLFALASADAPYIPAFLIGLDESDVRKMLTKERPLVGDETEDEKMRLHAYDALRREALEYMDQGGKFDDFVSELASFDRKQRQAQVTSLSEIMRLYKAGKITEAREMAVAANVFMTKNGYKPLTFPAKIRADFDNLPTVIPNKGE